MSEEKDTGWYVRQDHPHQVMDCIGNHVADTYGKHGDEAATRAQLVVTAVNERDLVEAVVSISNLICQYGALQTHMKNLRRAVLDLQKHRTAVESLKQMRAKL